MKRRLERLLQQTESAALPPQALQAVRAVEVLEHIGTREARQLLEMLADSAPGPQVLEDADAALRRLDKRPKK